MLFSMLRFVSVCLIAALFLSPVSQASDANGSSSQIQPLAIESIILDIATKGATTVAVGERGHVFILNGEKEGLWTQVSTPTQAHLTKVFFITPELGWAVGHDATIIHTIDAGLTWQLQMGSPEIEKPLMDILFFDEQNGVAIGAYGLFYRTSDGGKTWLSEYHEELLFEEDVSYLAELKAEDEALYLSERSALLPHFNRINSLSNGQLIMVGELGLVAVSDNRGKQWTKVDFIYEGSLFNTIQLNDTIFVMGLRGHIFQASLDMGSWKEVTLPVKSTINGALPNNDGGLILVGNAGVIIDVPALGESKIIHQRQGENLVAINQDPQGHIWVAGTKGLFELK
ncbi:BNR repeat protein [Shewanella sediminis HAW-EB3]|uniref:BNR repeat protein n=1 Tax=Shewanella sediminis (strain HAW-EB3) TaxID=425104 RepID=A8FW64_SHESH|nr:YCF48-related protein [Shewanella sediminis]ABV37087.1 BNR repeat protein [Shewanella sediminis HAW-EB3]